jgi:hypothetical protein
VTRPLIATVLLFALALCAPRTAAAAHPLPDSTLADSWRLANGLEVRMRHVPGARGVAITLAYRAGEASEPADRKGLASLLAELQFTSPAGTIPERSRQEMESLRPLGWGLEVHDHVTLLTEVAAGEQFPGVLRQVATRMRGVQVTDSSYAHALRSVRRDLGGRTFGEPSAALYHRARALARGLDDNGILRAAAAGDLAGLDAARATALLRRLYVPANAALAIAGDFANVDVRAVIEREFADIPGGTAAPDTAQVRLLPGLHASTLGGLPAPVGVVGVLSPALDDSLQPAFFLGTLLAGGMWTNTLGAPAAPLESYFHYSVLDEPEMAQFSAPVPRGITDPLAVSAKFGQVMEDFRAMAVTAPVMLQVRANVDWLLGGPLPPGLLRQSRQDPDVLSTLTMCMATRACWRGDGFWDAYRERFENTRRGHSTFLQWMENPEHQAVLLLTPRQ